MIRPLSPVVLIVALIPATAPLAAQGTTATASITFEVREVNELSVSGDPGPLLIRYASAGTAPAVAVDEVTTWRVATNQTRRKITGVLDSDLPPGLTLHIALAPPEGGVSAGAVPLSTAPRELVTGFGSAQSPDLGISYTLSATPEAGIVPRGRRTVTFTILAGT